MPRDELLLSEIVDAIDRILHLVGDGTAGEIESDRNRLEALLWNFTVLGEAIAQVSATIKEAHQEIAWASPVRMRNRIVHGYWSVDLDVLLTTARDDLPAFLSAVRRLQSS